MTIRIPLAKPEITDADREAVMQVLRTPHLSMGPKLREFEQAICDYSGSKYAIAVNSGTSALQLAVRTLNIERGSEVILPSFTFSALLNVVLQEGLQPRFVDLDSDGFSPSPEQIAAAITPKTRLVLAVHTFGFPLNVAAIDSSMRSLLPSHTIHLIEDACEALGTEVNGRKGGSIGKAGMFAFYPNKQITTGEGGVLVTCDKAIALQAEYLRNQGRDPTLSWLDYAQIGFSYRLSDMNCALGISQLRRIEEIVARRQKLAEVYDRELEGIREIIRPPLRSSVGRISWFVYPIVLSREFTRQTRDSVCDSMRRKGIATGRYFAPLHQQPILARHGISSVDLRNTDSVSDRIIALPFFNELMLNEIQEVCSALDESIRDARRKT